MSIDQKNSLLTEIDGILDTVRPHLLQDGGDVEVVELTNDFVVKVKWLGNCQLCSMSEMTLKAGIEQALKAQMPQIKKVVAISDSMV